MPLRVSFEGVPGRTPGYRTVNAVGVKSCCCLMCEVDIHMSRRSANKLDLIVHKTSSIGKLKSN